MTLVELLVYIVISGAVMAGIFQLLMGQSRSYGKQRELMDVHETIRGAAAMLAWEIRQGSAHAGGDLYAVGANSITLRSIQGAGVVCALHNTLPHVGLGKTWGDFAATVDDSALVYSASGNMWIAASIPQFWPVPGGGAVPWCDWGGGNSIAPEFVTKLLTGDTPPDIAIGNITLTPQGSLSPGATVTFVASHPLLTCAEFDFRAFRTIDAPPVTSGGMSGCTFAYTIPVNSPSLDFKIKIEISKDDYAQLTEDLLFDGTWYGATLDGGGGSISDYVDVGAPLRAFRRIEYGIYLDGGRWWLGRKVGAAASYEKLTGPLRSDVDGGLVFTYYDAAGAVTADPAQVRAVEFIIRAESYSLPDSRSGYQVDTLATRVAVRG